MLNLRHCGMENVSCTVYFENELSLHVLLQIEDMLLDLLCHILSCFPERSEEMVGICVACMSRVGLKRAFSGIHTKLSAGQQAFFLCLISHEPLLLG